MRETRESKGQGLQHVVIQERRGSGLFAMDERKALYLQLLMKALESSEIRLYAYSILPTHVHLILEELTDGPTCGEFLRKVHAPFGVMVRKQYPITQSGSLFRDRFRSERILSEEQLLRCMRAIHQEPYKLKLCSHMADYPWSSYAQYLNRLTGKEGAPGPDTSRVLQILHFAGGVAAFMEEEKITYRDTILEEVPDTYVRSDEEAMRIFERYLKGKTVEAFRRMSYEDQYDLLRIVKHNEDINLRQLSRISGVSRGIIQRL